MRKIFNVKFLGLIGLIIITFLLTSCPEVLESKENRINEKEYGDYTKYDDDILLELKIFNSDRRTEYFYQINIDGTLKLTITEEKLFDNRWDYNIIYENTIKLTQSDIETLKNLAEAAFQPEELEKESIFYGDGWGVRVYYKDKFDKATPYHFEFKRVLFDLVEEILRLGPDDFEGKLVYEEEKDKAANE